MLLLNIQTNKLENVPDNLVRDKILSGKYKGQKGTKIPMYSPQGTMELVPIENAYNNLSFGGYEYADLASVEQSLSENFQEDIANIYDKPWVAAAMGAASTGSFGLSDVLLSSIGLAEPAARVKESSSVANLAGQIVGAVTPWGIPSAISGAAGKVASNIASKTALGATGKAITAQALEGGAYGLQNVISNASLYGDSYLNAQNVMMDVGLGGIIGGVGGLATRGTEAVFGALNKKIDSVLAPALAKEARAAQEATQAAEAFGAKVKKFDEDTILNKVLADSGIPEANRAKYASMIKNDDELFGKILTNKNSGDFVEYITKNSDLSVDDALNLVKNPSAIREAMNDPIGAIRNSTASVKEIRNTLKSIGQDALDFRNLQRGDITIPENITIGKLENTVNYLGKEIQKSVNKMKKAKGTYSQPEAEYLSDLRTKLIESTSKAKTPAELHQAIEDIRLGLDAQISWATPVNKIVRKNTENEFKSLRTTYAKHLKNQKYYGEFGGIYDTMNSIYSTTSELNKTIFKNFATKSDDGTIKFSQSKMKDFLSNNNKELFNSIDGVVNKFDSIKANITDKNLFDTVSSKVESLKKTSETLRQYQNAARVVKYADQKAKGFATQKLSLKEPVMKQPLTEQQATGGFLGDTAFDLIGTSIFTPWAAVAIAKRVLKTNPQKLNTLRESVKSFLGKKSVKTIRSGINRAAVESIINIFSDNANDEMEFRSESNLGKARNNLNKYAAATGMIYDKLASSLPGVSGADADFFTEIHNKIADVSAFLASKLPNVQIDTVFKPEYKLSKSDEKRFEAYVTAALTPSVFFDELAEGKVRPETLETVLAIYPSIYDEAKTEVVSQLSELSDLPYSRKLAIARLFNLPTIPALEYLPTLQNIAAQPGVDVQGEARQKISKAMDRSVTDSYKTDLQKIT